MVLFISSELMFFGGLFAAYFTLRNLSQAWPPSDVHFDLVVPVIATVILTTSSATIEVGIRALRRGMERATRRWVILTIALGIIFLWLKIREWSTAGFSVSSHAYGSMFYGMIGFHGLHMLAGLILLGGLLARMAQGAYRDGRVAGAEAIAYYWHFVDTMWLGIFTTIYLIR
jgi:cytochrome c oxidase subunit 3